MVIALDWDGTFTLDHNMWCHMLQQWNACGHTCVIVTGRDELIDCEIKNFFCSKPHYSKPAAIIYCGNEYKRKVCESRGLFVDVWIDNEPGHIEPSRKLEW